MPNLRKFPLFSVVASTLIGWSTSGSAFAPLQMPSAAKQPAFSEIMMQVADDCYRLHGYDLCIKRNPIPVPYPLFHRAPARSIEDMVKDAIRTHQGPAPAAGLWKIPSMGYGKTIILESD